MIKVRFEEMRFAWLHSFVCVCKFKSYTEAASYLGISQSTVTRHISSLESWFGSELLTKNIPPQLTDRGKTAYNICEDIIWKISDFSNVVERSLDPGSLSIHDKELLRSMHIFGRLPLFVE